jgi:glutaredoxin
MNDHQVTVYTRVGCHLCDEAKELLERYGLEPELIDIDADPQLRERYTTCVPVVLIDGKERFRGRVNEFPLRRLLSGSRAASE